MNPATTPNRLLRILLAVFALVFGLAGCRRSEAGAGGGPIVIQFWNGFSGPDGEMMEALVRRFNKQNRDVQVRMQVIPWATYYDKVTLGLAFGGAPDVFVLHANRVPEYAAHEVLAPMDALMARAGLEREEFVPKAWPAGIYNDRRYGLPLDCHPIGLYYNLDLFRQAGITRPPTNLDEFLDAAKRLTRDTDGDGRIDQWGFAFTWLHSNGVTFLNQFGAALLDPDLKRSAVATPEAKEAVRLMRRMIVEERICPVPEGTDAWLGFQTGKVAMALEGVYMMTSLERREGLRYGAAPCPQFGPKPAVWAGSHCLAMPATNAPRRTEAAWRFIRFLSDQSLEWAAGGQVPVRTALLSTPDFQRMRIQREFAKSLDVIEYEPRSVRFNQVSVFLDSAFEAALNGIAPIDQALETADRRINRVMARP